MQKYRSSGYRLRLSNAARAARERWHLGVTIVIGLWLLVAGGLLLAAWRGMHVMWWDIIHSLTLGVVSTAILAYSTHFTEALTRTAPGRYRWLAARIGVVQLSLLALLSARVGEQWGPIADTAAAATIAAFAVHAWALARRMRGGLSSSLANSLAPTVHYYLGACVFLVGGVGLAAAAGRGLGEYDQLIAAHSRAMVWGFGWTSIVGTSVTLLPTLAGTSISAAARSLMPRALVLHMVGLLVAVVGFAADVPLAEGGGLFTVACASLRVLMCVVSGARAGTNNAGALASACAGLGWLSLVLLADAASVCVGVLPRHITFRLAAPLLGAGVIQLILAVLAHLVPTLRGGGPTSIKNARARAQTGARIRLVLINLGAALVLASNVDFAFPGGATLNGGAAVGITMMSSGLFGSVLALAWSVGADPPTRPGPDLLGPKRSENYSTRAPESKAESDMNIPLQPPSQGGTDTAADVDVAQSKNWVGWLTIACSMVVVVVLAIYAAFGTNPNGKSGGISAESIAGDGHTVEVDVVVKGMAFSPDSVVVPPGSSLKINFTNTGDRTHDLKIGSAETGRVEPGKTATLETGPLTESVEGYCTIAGHKMQGMTFMVNVVGAGSANSADSTDGASAGGANTGSAGHTNHDHAAMMNGSNPAVKVPSMAERMAPRPENPAFDAALKPAPAGKVHEVTWTMTEEVQEVAPGVRQMRWLFNGQAPGPALRGKVGDTFKVTIKNEGSMGHSIDFHAGEVTPDDVMKTIEPGQELTYEFTAKRSGIWMYHCATAPMSLHIANGMAGAVIIDPADLNPVDAEYAFVADEVFLGDEQQGADAQRVFDGEYDLMAFNYYPNQYDQHPLQAKVGDTVRIWLLNVGPDQPLSFHLVGEIFDKTYAEGAVLMDAYGKNSGGIGQGSPGSSGSTGSQALSLLPAQGGYVEVTFDEPGTYTFVNHIMTNAEKGQHGQIVVSK